MAVPEIYDAYWKERSRPSEVWNLARVQNVLGPLLGRKHVLDYGCGIGQSYRPVFSQKVAKYAGADVSRFALETLDASTQDGYLINPDDSTISAPAGTFDGACCIEVLEHLFDPLAAAKELFRVLQPGGVVVATVPNFGYHAWRVMAALRAQVPAEPERPKENRFNGVHIRFFNTGTFARLFRDAGFTVTTVSSFDDSSIWDVTRAFGPAAAISDWARAHLPPLLQLRFLQDLAPSVFAYRIRVVAEKAR